MALARRPQHSSSFDSLSQLAKLISSLLPHSGLALISKRRWSDRFLVFCAILISMVGGPALLDRFKLARSLIVQLNPTRKRPGAGYGGFIDTLTRHSERLLAVVIVSLRKAVVRCAGPQWRTHGFVLLGVDGTKIEVPRTDANIDQFKIANKTHAGPEMLLTCLFHLNTRALWSFRRDCGTGSERGLLQKMIPDLPNDSLIVADAGFTGWNTIKALNDAGQHFVIRAGANVKLITTLGCHVQECDGVVYLWPGEIQKKNVAPIILRRVMVSDGKGRQMCLLTNVMDHARLGDAAIVEIYKLRWGVELAYRCLKETLQGRKMLSTSPSHAEVELDWTMIGMWVLTLLALGNSTSGASGKDVSPAGALRVVREMVTHRHPSRRRVCVAALLSSARTDRYSRKRAKSKKHYPKQSRCHRCRIPLARTGKAEEIARYQAILATVH